MDMDVTGFFYRYNIHPFQECLKREEESAKYSKSIGLPMIFQKDYKIEEFIQSIAFRESQRCQYCYYHRLKTTAAIAKKGKFQGFTTTLLYSKFQNHKLLKQTGYAVAKEYGINFFYHDFRENWKNGINESKRLSMYRQQYCGCIYSEKERYLQSKAIVQN